MICPNCQNDNDREIVKAPVPQQMIGQPIPTWLCLRCRHEFNPGLSPHAPKPPGSMA
jgi:uncharacterized protein with PIN domain